MNVVLIGYRGTGKSTVGKVVAARLGCPIVSTDREIIRRAGSSIPDIVAAHGWDYFRDLESAVCLELAGQDNLVIDTGGCKGYERDLPRTRRRIHRRSASIPRPASFT